MNRRAIRRLHPAELADILGAIPERDGLAFVLDGKASAGILRGIYTSAPNPERYVAIQITAERIEVSRVSRSGALPAEVHLGRPDFGLALTEAIRAAVDWCDTLVVPLPWAEVRVTDDWDRVQRPQDRPGASDSGGEDDPPGNLLSRVLRHVRGPTRRSFLGAVKLAAADRWAYHRAHWTRGGYTAVEWARYDVAGPPWPDVPDREVYVTLEHDTRVIWVERMVRGRVEQSPSVAFEDLALEVPRALDWLQGATP